MHRATTAQKSEYVLANMGERFPGGIIGWRVIAVLIFFLPARIISKFSH